MGETVNLTLALAGYFYFGSLAQWCEYARVLAAGRIAAYRKSLAYGKLRSTSKCNKSIWDDVAWG